MKEKIILLIMAYFLQEAKSLPDQFAEDYLAQYRETRNLLQNPGLAKISGNNYNRDLHPRDMASPLDANAPEQLRTCSRPETRHPCQRE